MYSCKNFAAMGVIPRSSRYLFNAFCRLSSRSSKSGPSSAIISLLSSSGGCIKDKVSMTISSGWAVQENSRICPSPFEMVTVRGMLDLEGT
ncbi:Os01g0143750 [Oryza sativa Japonica Group]|uniref:Os01g0143750 protein n=1 Tax=Oryza sativa subsp. japonica TaxID=39947 RepID=A0A0N7KCB4_ORYSJ|nr:Os01g0143750 [Oryza sativa Japonica Group]